MKITFLDYGVESVLDSFSVVFEEQRKKHHK